VTVLTMCRIFMMNAIKNNTAKVGGAQSAKVGADLLQVYADIDRRRI
jgi:hypothetical protein